MPEVGLVEGRLEPGLCPDGTIALQILNVREASWREELWWLFRRQSMSMPFSCSLISVPIAKFCDRVAIQAYAVRNTPILTASWFETRSLCFFSNFFKRS